MEPSPHIGTTSTLDDNEGLRVRMGSIAKRPYTVLLEEKIEDHFQPTEEELLEYALWLGMSIPRDMDLMWIARDGLTQPLPKEWKPCQTEDDEIYYFNFETGESVWDHPCDGLYRKLYQEECKRLGKRPYQIRENSNCSSKFQQQITNWGEKSTHAQAAHPMDHDEMMNEKEEHSPRRFALENYMGSERMPSNKEIQMNIVEKEIDSLKEIRAHLLEQMNTLWQEGQFSTLAPELQVERVANYNQLEQEHVSLLEGSKDKLPSLEVECFREFQAQPYQDGSKVQIEQDEEDPRRAQKNIDMLHKQQEMPKMFPVQLISKEGGEDIHDSRQMYQDHNTGLPIRHASKVLQEANEQAAPNHGGRDALQIVREELKKEELIIIDEMKQNILLEVRKSMDAIGRSAFEEEYQLALEKKKENLELLCKELRKDVEFQLLQEEESLLKRKREEMLAKLRHSQSGRENVFEHEGYQVANSTLRSAQVVNQGEKEDLKELILQWRSELRDDIVSLKSKMNEILVSLPETNQLSLEAQPLLTVPAQDICKASNDTPPSHTNSTMLLYKLQKMISDLDSNLKHVLQEREMGLTRTINFPRQLTKLEDIAHQSNLLNQNIDTIHGHDFLSPEVTSSNTLSILKECLLALDEELQMNINHREEKVIKNKNLKCFSSNTRDAALEMQQNDRLSFETSFLLKKVIKTLEEPMKDHQILEQGAGPKDKVLGLSLNTIVESSKPKHGLESQFLSLNEDLVSLLGQFKAISIDMISSLRGFIGELYVERTLWHKRELQSELNGLRSHCNSTNHGQITLESDQQTLTNDDGMNEMREMTCGETGLSFESLSTHNLGMFEGFIGTLHQELKDNMSRRDKMAYKDTDCVGPDVNPIVPYDTLVQIQETSLQGHCKPRSLHDAWSKPTIPDMSFSALSSNTLRNVKGFVDELHQEIMSSIQHRSKSLDEGSSNFLTTLQPEDTHVSTLLDEKKLDTPPVFQNEEGGVIPQDHVLKLHRLSTEALCTLEKFRSQGDKEWQNEVLQGERERQVNATSSKLDKLDDVSDSFRERINFETQAKSVSHANVDERTLDAHSTSSNVNLVELKRFISKVDEDLRAIIQNCGAELQNKRDRVSSERKEIEFHEFHSETECELKSRSFIPILKAWSVKMEKSTEHLLQQFKSQLMEEMNMSQNSICKADESSTLLSVDGDGHQPQKSQHLTQVQTLVAEEKRIWYDILNDATKQWLQKDWVERLEQQSDWTTTCDHSISPPNSEYLAQVQKVLGEEKKIMYDILNNSTQKWLRHQRNPLGFQRNFEGNAEETSTCEKGGLKDEHLQRATSKTNYNGTFLNAHVDGKELRETQSQGVSHTVNVLHCEEDHGRPKIFTDDFQEVLGCRPCNKSQSSCSAKDHENRDENTFAHSEVDDPQNHEKGKLTRQFSTTKSNLLSINHWISTAKPFGAFKRNDDLGLSQEVNLCEYEQFPIYTHKFPPSCQSYNSHYPGCNNTNNRVHTCGLSISKSGKNLESDSEQTFLEVGSTREIPGMNHDKTLLPRSIHLLKSVSKKGRQILQSNLGVPQAIRWAQIMASWALKQVYSDLLLRRDSSNCSYAIHKSMRTIIRKLICGQAIFGSPNRDETCGEGNVSRDNHEGSGFVDHNVMRSTLYPSMKSGLARSSKFKLHQFWNKTAAPVDIEGSTADKPNPSTGYGEVQYSFPEWKTFDESPNLDERNEIPSSNHGKSHPLADSIENSFTKYRSDDDLALSIVENGQCDVSTPPTRGFNSRDATDMHELEEAINNLRKSRELEAKGKGHWVNHCQINGNNDSNLEDESKEVQDYVGGFDFGNGNHVIDHMSLNESVQKVLGNGHLGDLNEELLPKFITFEILQQGEIALPKIISTEN